MQPVVVALDWTPNTAHAGFYVAKARGWYAAAGLDVTLLSPHADGYKRTPASRLADGSALFAVTPTESVISSHTQPPGAAAPKPPLVAVAALQQGCTSAIVTLKTSGIDTLAKLDGKVYASYGARYEGRIVQAMVKSAGGTGEFVEWAPPMLGLWNTVLSGEAHATWVFLGWEGVEAERKGVALNVFRLRDSGIPYGYSPVLAADPARLDPAVATAFLAATARGFDAAREQPEAAAAELCALAAAENPGLPAPLDAEMCAQSLRWLAAEGALAAPWGRMDRARWAAFLRWLDESGLLTSALPSRAPGGGDGAPERSLDDLRGGRAGEPVAAPDVDKLYTNAYLPA